VENVEIAWSVKGAPEVKKNHGNGDAFHQYDMNGKTLTNVKLITSAGIYNISCKQKLTPYYNGTVTYTATDATTVSVSGLPTDIINAKATVSYTVGSGRDSKTYYRAQDVEVKDGTITITDGKMYQGTTYTVVVTSDNYAQITGTVSLAQNEEESEYTYLYAALTWDEYWASEGVYAAGNTTSSTDKDSKGETDKGAFDVVSRATANHGLHRGSFQSVAVIYAENGDKYTISYWSAEDKQGNTAVLTDGRTLVKSTDRSTGTTTLTLSDGTTTTMDHYEVTGIKYVPVRVATADLAQFCEKYTVVENGGTLEGGYSEQNLTAYTATAAVDENTNGLKVATKNSDGTFTFSARSTGTGSGLKDASQKQAENITVTVQEASGNYGEFLRVDLTGDGYGDLGSNMYAVVWTYYGSDSTYTSPLQSYGTKFAADNWMHKSMGIQLGLTDSLRCQLPDGTDGTGYWTLTVCAMGYEDYTVKFQAEAKNIVGLKVEEETKVDTSALEALVNQAKALTESDYTAASWNNLAIELSESVEMLKSTTLTQAQVNEQVTHLTEAINGLVKAEQSGDKDDPADNKGDQNGNQNGNNQNGNTNSGNTNAGNTNAGNNQSGATNTGSQSGNTSTDKTNTSTNKTSTNKTSTDKTTSSTGSTGESTVVKTADESHILLWLGALVVSCLAFVGTVVFARKKQD
jgi:hypothetical protein